MSKTTPNSRETSGTSHDNLWSNWKAVLACVLLATLASFQSTNNKETSSGLNRLSDAHVITRPNPDAIGSNQDETINSFDQLLRAASRSWTVAPEHAEGVSTNKPIGPESRKILHDSFSDVDQNPERKVVPYGSGLIEGIIRAFQQDLHLVLHPDDIWLAITTQLSFYLNAHAKKLRHLFVTHEGQKQLIVDLRPLTMGSLHSISIL